MMIAPAGESVVFPETGGEGEGWEKQKPGDDHLLIIMIMAMMIMTFV